MTLVLVLRDISISVSRHWKTTTFSDAALSVLRTIRLALVRSTLVPGGFFTFVKRSNLLGSEGIAVDADVVDAAGPDAFAAVRVGPDPYVETVCGDAPRRPGRYVVIPSMYNVAIWPSLRYLLVE